jgi:hypothetical protein
MRVAATIAARNTATLIAMNIPAIVELSMDLTKPDVMDVIEKCAPPPSS